MKKLLIFFLLFLSKIYCNYIIHNKIHEAPYNLPCLVEAFLNTQDIDIHNFSLLYRPTGSVEYLEAPMILMGQLKYMAEIPGNFMVRDQIEYYLILELSYGEKVTFPQNDAIQNPIIIQIELPHEKIIPISPSEINNFDIEGLSPEIIIISPQPGERVRRRDLFIALSYFREKDVDPTKVSVYLDGQNVTNKADIDSTYLSFSSESVAPGMHTITINITNKYEQKFDDISWDFTVLPGNATEAGLIKKQSGGMRVNYTGGSTDKSKMNIGEIDMQYAVSLDWFQLTAKYKKSSLENKYDQPRDRYALDLKNQHLNIKFGDSYPSIDQYALDGHHVRGVNFNFVQAPFSVDIIKGYTARAIQGNHADNAIEISEVDSTTDNWVITLSRNNYTFQQELFAAKIGMRIGENFYWDINYIKVEDNIDTVVDTMLNAVILIPSELQSSEDEISYNNLRNDPNILGSNTLGSNTSIIFPTKNWIGIKPRDNLIYGSNIKFNFDNSRIQVSSGFSISFLNRNTWENLQSVSELDTFAFDDNLDGYFLDYLQLDNTKSPSQFETQFNFGMNQQPMVPSIFQKDGTGIINILNMSNLSRYNKLQLHYLGHRVELGNKRNGPDYYSILNPSLKTNITESYISDRLHLFQNRLLLYYKRSKIIEGLYAEQKAPIENRKSSFNISLLPDIGLPTVNFGFSSSSRSNNSDEIFDSVTYLYTDSRDTTVIFIRKEETVNKLFNISMTNQFKLWGDQVLSVNVLLSDLTDKVAENISQDTMKYIGYLPKNATSESYGINLKSIYNNYWESTVYLNASYYDFGHKNFGYYQKRNLRNIQLNFVYRPQRYITKLQYGFRFSTNRGIQENTYMTQYNFNFGAESEPLENLNIFLSLDYRNKYVGINHKNSHDFFIRVQVRYDI